MQDGKEEEETEEEEEKESMWLENILTSIVEIKFRKDYAGTTQLILKISCGQVVQQRTHSLFSDVGSNLETFFLFLSKVIHASQSKNKKTQIKKKHVYCNGGEVNLKQLMKM